MMNWLMRLMATAKGGGYKTGPEDRLSIHFANCCRAWTLAGELKGIWFHVANELGGGKGKPSQVIFAKAKAMGLITGCGDHIHIWDDGGGVLEAKVGRNKQTQHQLDFEAWCHASGIRYEVFRTVQEGAAFLKEWGVLDPDAPVPMAPIEMVTR